MTLFSYKGHEIENSITDILQMQKLSNDFIGSLFYSFFCINHMLFDTTE